MELSSGAMRAAQLEEPALSLPKGPAVVLAFAVACPFVCHSAAQRRNLLLLLPLQLSSHD
jgi:hypothetical protein